MDEETILKAKLAAAVICRALDYHALTTATHTAPKSTSKDVIAEALVTSERAVSVALENLLDAGLE